MRWANFFHIYQPPEWNEDIIRRAANEAYWPLIRILQRHPKVKVTLNITGALTEQLLELGLEDIMASFRSLLERGQIEFVDSAMYHPILPLLPKDEVRRQIELQHELHQRVLGPAFRPNGFYAPEMAWHPDLEPLLLEMGYEWIIVDEIAISGSIGEVPLHERYVTPGGLGVIIRNRHISDFLSFSARLDDIQEVYKKIVTDARSLKLLVTAMDGENLGHHRHGVDQLWEKLVTHEGIVPATISEFYDALDQRSTVATQACSWSSQEGELRADVPYSLWNHPANPMHKLQWELTHLVIKTVHRSAADENFEAARRLLDQTLTSDKYWWASASPWWDMTIVIRETQRLADVIAPLTSVPTPTKNKVARLLEQLTRTAELWDKTGLAKQRQSTYLQSTGEVKFMGGRQVTP